MTVKPQVFLKQISREIALSYDTRESDAIAMLLFEEYLSLDRANLMINDDLVITEDTLDLINSAIERISSHEPVQYILGKSHFYGYDFEVNPSVLIPRPETEELVDLVIRDYKGKSVSILDIGTGSGCIPISLSKNLPNSSISGLDISDDAISQAKANADKLAAKVSFHQMDILTNYPDSQYDVVISNPPYITETEKLQMHKNVLAYEPELALFVPDHDPLLFYRRITEICKTILKSEGRLYFEINEHYGPETKTLMEENGFNNTEIIHDLSGKNRIVTGILSA